MVPEIAQNKIERILEEFSPGETLRLWGNGKEVAGTIVKVIPPSCVKMQNYQTEKTEEHNLDEYKYYEVEL